MDGSRVGLMVNVDFGFALARRLFRKYIFYIHEHYSKAAFNFTAIESVPIELNQKFETLHKLDAQIEGKKNYLK